MKYNNITLAKFVSRPNRFIANVEIDGKCETVHVKNTGRCRELLVPGAKVVLEKSTNPERKTKYDLVAVYKGQNLINMDSTAPNVVFGEWVKDGGFFKDVTFVKPEYTYKNSRFDFYIETVTKKILVEVKGVTLEDDGVVMFPDAPTERGTKHVNELCKALADGYESYIFFVIQMEKCKVFTPNIKTDKKFSEALKNANDMGVNVFAVCCNVGKDFLEIKDFVDVSL